MSFDPKNKADKAKLYPVLKALADLDSRKTPELIMDDAVGHSVARGQDYVRNMRRGDIAATYATLIHQWLTEQHFELAHRLAADIFPETPEQRWQTILEQRARFDSFRLVLVPQVMGIVERESQLKSVDASIRLGERFCFELESEEEGFVIALQGVRGQWYNIPLGPNGEASAPIQIGVNQLPRIQGGQLDPLAENQDEGLHEFVLITAPTGDIPVDLKGLIARIAGNQCELHRVSVQVIK